MSDSKYFQTTKKGEIAEFREELNSTDRQKVKEAVKKVIATMTVGKDVSMLFTDLVKQMQTEDIELKKLIYLYIINYAKSMPEQSILVVNSFQRDALFPNPLVRGLAIRTLGCVRVDKLTEYLSEPLSKALVDSDAYVRKTAAICVAKLFDINPQLVVDQGFVGMLKELVYNDGNALVVANAVAALTEISSNYSTNASKELFKLDSVAVEKLLTALGSCTEWGQIFILDAIAKYRSKDELEAIKVIERILPRLQHANAAVVMSTIRIVINYCDGINDEAAKAKFYRKLAPPLVTLLSSEPEIQYVALRNINLIIQKRPRLLENEIKVFFCKYDDPIYVKMEKLDIIIKLLNNDIVDKVLPEFKEYATEVDVEFVRKAVRAIGLTAIKLPNASEKCIHVLVELINTKVNYVVQEAIIVIKDIFRKYPNKYESIIATLCENLESLDEPEAKAALVWIIGEYAERIDNAADLLEQFVDDFGDEHAQVQLQLLTAIVKLFLKKPDSAKELVTKILNLGTESCDNPDLRDRAFVYWRLLSTNPEAAKAVVLSERPPISDDSTQIEPSMLDQLIANISTLASIYHKLPESFIKAKKIKLTTDEDEEDEEEEEEEEDEDEEEEKKITKSITKDSSKASHATPSIDTSLDILGLNDIISAPQKSTPVNTNAGLSLDPLDFGSIPTTTVPDISGKVLVSTEKGKGIQISTSYGRFNNSFGLNLTFTNSSSQSINRILLKVNPKNSLGLVMDPNFNVKTPLQPGQQTSAILLLSPSGELDSSKTWGRLEMALRTDLGDVKFDDNIPAYHLFSEDGQLSRDEYLKTWRSIPDESEYKHDIGNINNTSLDSIVERLEKHNIFTVAKRNVAGKRDVLYCSSKFKGVVILFEFTIPPNKTNTHSTSCTRSVSKNLCPIAARMSTDLLK